MSWSYGVDNGQRERIELGDFVKSKTRPQLGIGEVLKKTEFMAYVSWPGGEKCSYSTVQSPVSVRYIDWGENTRRHAYSDLVRVTPLEAIAAQAQ